LILAGLLAAATVAGLVQAIAGHVLLRRFLRRRPGRSTTPVSILKPLAGDEPTLEEALECLFHQDHPALQIVFGVQNPADPALAVVARLRVRHPDVDVAVVVDPSLPSKNRKTSNLIHMLPVAKHGVIVVSDADVHVPRCWLGDVLATLDTPGTGLVTALYKGRPAVPGPVAILGAAGMTTGFLPGALLARALGRRDCFGATMALRRSTLDAIGGFAALGDHIADDHLLGVLVKRQGLDIALARSVVRTSVPETRMRGLFTHELRWARTIRRLAPYGYVASVLQFPLFWSALASLADWHFAFLFPAAWAVRVALDHATTRLLRRPPFPIWVPPLRDLLSVVVWGASFLSDNVTWRGNALHVAGIPNPPQPSATMEHQPQ
jgi:ceramide glucosyltransferase